MTDQVMSDSSRMSFSRYITTLTDSTLEQMANQLMEEDPNSEELELITDEIELRQIRATGPIRPLKVVIVELTQELRPDLPPTELQAAVEASLELLEYTVARLDAEHE